MQKIADHFKNERRLRWIENSAALSTVKKYSVGTVAAGSSAAVVTQSFLGWKAHQGLYVSYYLKNSASAAVSITVNGSTLLLDHAAGSASAAVCPEIKKGVNTLTVTVTAEGGSISSGEILTKIVDLG